MKIVIIGASGTVGRAVTEELSRRHEVIRVGRTQGDHQAYSYFLGTNVMRDGFRLQPEAAAGSPSRKR